MFVSLPVDSAGRSRLLPWTIPFRFFATAAVFHALAWPLLLLAPADVPSFQGGLGPVLAALHAIALGTLAMTAIGASLQLLPVATVQAVASERLAALLWWVYAPSVALVVAGMATRDVMVLAAGSAGTIVALALYSGLLGHNLARARRQQDSVQHGWAAWAALVGVMLSAAAIVWWYTGGGLARPRSVALVHALLGLFGFMTVLAVGFAYILVPMFAVTKQPAPALRRGVLVLGVAALLLAVAGAMLQGWPGLLGAAALLGLIASLAHVGAMARELKRRLRRAIGPWFALVAFGWTMLPASLAVGVALAFGVSLRNGPALFGATAAVGWLLSFLLGTLSRIAPFLASVHAMGSRRAPPLVSALTPLLPLRIHRVLHAGALLALLGGIALDAPGLVQAAAVAGTGAGVAYLGFIGGVVRRLRRARAEAAAGTRDTVLARRTQVHGPRREIRRPKETGLHGPRGLDETRDE